MLEGQCVKLLGAMETLECHVDEQAALIARLKMEISEEEEEQSEIVNAKRERSYGVISHCASAVTLPSPGPAGAGGSGSALRASSLEPPSAGLQRSNSSRTWATAQRMWPASVGGIRPIHSTVRRGGQLEPSAVGLQAQARRSPRAQIPAAGRKPSRSPPPRPGRGYPAGVFCRDRAVGLAEC